MKATINGVECKPGSSSDFSQILSDAAREKFREVWLSSPNGASIVALLNGKRGWLLFLPGGDHPGFSSRNAERSGDETDQIEYALANGQVDEYPASWALKEQTVHAVLAYFFDHASRSPLIAWHDDSA